MSEGIALKYYALLLIIPVTCLILLTFGTILLTEHTALSCIEQGFEWIEGACRYPQK